MFLVCVLLLILTLFPCYFLGCFNFKIINYYLILFWSILIFCIIGSFLIYLNLVDDLFFVEPIKNEMEVKAQGFLVTIVSFCILFFSIWTIEVLFNFLRNRGSISVDWNDFVNKKTSSDSSYVYWAVFTLFIFSSLYYFWTIYPSPLQMAFMGATDAEIANKRIEVTRYYSGIPYIKTASIISSYLSVFLFFLIRDKKRLIYYFLLIAAFLLLMMNGEKAPVFNLLLGLVVVHSHLKEVRYKNLVYLALCFVFLLFGLYAVFFSQRDFNGTLSLIFERIFVAQEIAVFYAVKVYHSENFLGFSSLTSFFTTLLGVEAQARASEEFVHLFQPSMGASTWNINGFFAHEAFASFGWYGVVLGSMWGGVVNSLICIWFRIQKTKSHFLLSLYTLFVVSFTSVITSFNLMLFNSFLILAVCIYLGVRALGWYGRVCVTKN